MFLVKKPGPLSLIQDAGRNGFQRFGITQGGPMDQHAFCWANKILGNSLGAAQIEIAVGGFLGEFTQPSTFSICGADLQARLNDVAIEPWASYRVEAGDQLSLTRPVSGLRAYLAVKGGFHVKPQWQSCATVVREKLGGLHADGLPLKEGDEIPYDSSIEHVSLLATVPARFIPDYSNEITVRVIPYHGATSAGSLAFEQLIKRSWLISPQSDRMGYRLSGSALESSVGGVISHGVPVGAIQLPPDGQPIILMRDHQTMGGYPLLGVVATRDLSLLGQCAPNVKLRFVETSSKQLEAESKSFYSFFNSND